MFNKNKQEKKKVLVAGMAAAILLSSGMTCSASALSASMTPEEYTRYLMTSSFDSAQMDMAVNTVFTLSDGTETYVLSSSSAIVDEWDADAEHVSDTWALTVNDAPFVSGTEEGYIDYNTGVQYFLQNGAWTKTSSGTGTWNIDTETFVSQLTNIQMQDNGTQTVISANVDGAFLEDVFSDETMVTGPISDGDICLVIVADSATDKIQSLQVVYAPSGDPASVLIGSEAVGSLDSASMTAKVSGSGTTNVEVPAEVIAGAVEE